MILTLMIKYAYPLRTVKLTEKAFAKCSDFSRAVCPDKLFFN